MDKLTAQTNVAVIADSIAHGVRLVTLALRYPRFIHSELMTHRVFSRNAMSSRAVPVAKMIEQVRTNPAMPCHWGSNKPGMQAGDELKDSDLAKARAHWRSSAADAATRAERMMELGLHKQVCNRILEPFQWMHTLVSATEWDNFFALRVHPAAEPNFQLLAKMIQKEMEQSSPAERGGHPISSVAAWHLPYISIEERDKYCDNPYHLAKLSTARCARVSYLNHDGTAPNQEADLALFLRLMGSDPKHASPSEHQAFRGLDPTLWSRNFRGWVQHREFLET